jgi:hypothetical protein
LSLFHSISREDLPARLLVTEIISLPEGNLYPDSIIEYLPILMKHFATSDEENIKEISISNMFAAHIVCALRTRRAEQVVAAFRRERAVITLFVKLKVRLMPRHRRERKWFGSTIIWDVTPCILVEDYQHFRGKCCFHLLS